MEVIENLKGLDCKACSDYLRCERAFMRSPAVCEEYALMHGDVVGKSDVGEMVGNEEMREKATRETSEETRETSEESNESVVVKDSAGNGIVKYSSVVERSAAMEGVYEDVSAMAVGYSKALARYGKAGVVIDKKKSAEEYAAFIFLNSVIDEDSARCDMRCLACVPTENGRMLVGRNYESLHAVNVEFFDFEPYQTYRAFKNKLGLAYVPTRVDGFDFGKLAKFLEAEYDFRGTRGFNGRGDVLEYVYRAGVDGLPAFSVEQLKPLSVFKTNWLMSVPRRAPEWVRFENGNCLAFLMPSKFSVAHMFSLYDDAAGAGNAAAGAELGAAAGCGSAEIEARGGE